MTSAAPLPSHPPPSTAVAPTARSSITFGTTPSLSGAVPTQHPVRSYATATKTATPPTPAGASAPAQNAKPASDSHMNGAMAQGGSQAQPQMNNGIANGDHSRKPSVVFNAQGVYGSTSNGAPNGNKPPISFGSVNNPGPEAPTNVTFPSQNSNLPTPQRDPRVISPSHSPSPIPQPAASGGRPPSSLESQNNPYRFGSTGADGDMMRGGPMSQGGVNQGPPLHERRPSSHSMQSDLSNQGMPSNYNRQSMGPAGAGRGRGFAPQQPYMQSPGPQYRPMPGQQGRGNIPFQQPSPGSPFQRARASPVPMSAQPHMAQPHMGGNPQMYHQGYQQHLNPQHQMYNMQGYDPNTGYYQQYFYPGFPGQQPPQSPRPQYPSPFQGGQGQIQAPYHPPTTPGMARTPSQASERPPSSMGHSQTPAPSVSAPSQGSSSSQAPPPSQTNFVRPQRTSKAIVIKDPQGNEVKVEKKPAASSTQPQTPVIVSTPHAPTPPPRVPSSQQNRADPKSAPSSEDTKASFAEQVRRKKEEDEAKEREQKKSVTPEPAAAVAEPVKEAVAETEKAAAAAAGDEKAEAEADAALSASHKDDAEKEPAEETEDERIEREIAEMEAAEAAEEERERAFQEKRAKEREAASAKEKEVAARVDEDLKRQEHEAEERELEREREREAEKKQADEPDDEAKAMFASLKAPTLGPGASASGTETPARTETPVSEDDKAEPTSTAAPARSATGQKPKPAHLKLETNKPVERAEPTPGMQALKSARFLEIKDELKYPEGIQSPNPALNQTGARKGHVYDKDFLLQFQKVFREKPSVDWDQKVRETLGPSDDPGSARPQSARTPSAAMGSRQPSGRAGQAPIGNFGGPMGNFGGMARGTTSADRFQAATAGIGMGVPPRPGAPGMVRAPSNLGMGTPGVGMSRTNSVQILGGMGGPGSGRQPSSRGGKDRSRREDRVKSKREDADAAAKMPLTAHMEITPLEKSQTGWKPASLTSGAPTGPDPSGLMDAPMVQRKVKAALNKMTPEKFDKISDQILEIAAQSKNESDGRTLRQVIQLTFEKACDEAHWAGMYARFCHKMHSTMSSDIRDETIRDKTGNPVVGGALFRKYLLNRCQEEFERGWQANLPDKPEGESQEAVLLSDEYYIAAAAKRRGLGLIQFIGQLYKLRMLTLRIMHECVMRLLNFEGDPDEAAVENLTTLLKAVGGTMEEEEQGPEFINLYFNRINTAVLGSPNLPSRPRFMIMDLIDLRKAHWRGKDDSKGPKTIQQIHDEAVAAKAKEDAERQKASARGGPGGGRMPQGRGDARNFSGGMPPPQDYSRTHVNNDDLKRLQNRTAQRATGGLGPGGSLGPSMLGARTNSKRGLGPGSGNTTRTNTPPVDSKKEEPTQQNAFSALASLDSGEGTEDLPDATSPPPSAPRGEDKDESSTA